MIRKWQQQQILQIFHSIDMIFTHPKAKNTFFWVFILNKHQKKEEINQDQSNLNQPSILMYVFSLKTSGRGKISFDTFLKNYLLILFFLIMNNLTIFFIAILLCTELH